jgi:hypothetical protein
MYDVTKEEKYLKTAQDSKLNLTAVCTPLTMTQFSLGLV